ncbi:hypothetical protein GCM10010524_53450 [Streptomyces mexicanus]
MTVRVRLITLVGSDSPRGDVEGGLLPPALDECESCGRRPSAPFRVRGVGSVRRGRMAARDAVLGAGMGAPPPGLSRLHGPWTAADRDAHARTGAQAPARTRPRPQPPAPSVARNVRR